MYCEVKNQVIFTKQRGSNKVLVMQYFSRFKNFCGFASILQRIPLKTGNKVKQIMEKYLKLLNEMFFLFEAQICCFGNDHIHSVFSKLPNIVKLDVENDVITLSHVVTLYQPKGNVCWEQVCFSLPYISIPTSISW